MILRWLGLILIISWTSAAQAAVVIAPSGCLPNPPTIRDNRALIGNASVQHAGDNVDPIVLTCTVAPFDDSVASDWRIRIAYVDSNGATANASVQARLYRMVIGNDSPALLASVDSNDDAATGLNELSSDTFPHNFNFDARTYWFRIDIQRANPSQTVILHSVMIQPVMVVSDVRAKKDIAPVGKLGSGLGLYRFRYIGGDKIFVGVMAQEVEAIRPDAVIRGDDGFLRVNYARLGLRMQSWEEWVASGQEVRTSATPIQ